MATRSRRSNTQQRETEQRRGSIQRRGSDEQSGSAEQRDHLRDISQNDDTAIAESRPC